MPILDGMRVLGCLSMRFPTAAMSEDEVVQRYGKRLATLAQSIANDVAG